MTLSARCHSCNREQVIASGCVADSSMWPAERIRNALEKIGWGATKEGWECPECAGKISENSSCNQTAPKA